LLAVDNGTETILLSYDNNLIYFINVTTIESMPLPLFTLSSNQSTSIQNARDPIVSIVIGSIVGFFSITGFIIWILYKRDRKTSLKYRPEELKVENIIIVEKLPQSILPTTEIKN